MKEREDEKKRKDDRESEVKNKRGHILCFKMK